MAISYIHHRTDMCRVIAGISERTIPVHNYNTLWGTAFLNLYRTGHLLYILAPRYGMSQLIQARGGAEIAIKHHDVSPRRIVGKGSCPSIRQRGIGSIQFLRRIEDFFIVAIILHCDAQWELGI